MPIDLLLIEELLASESLWLQSPRSLRDEATAMVAAIAQDLAAISGLNSALLLSPASAASPVLQSLLPTTVRRCVTSQEPGDWLRQPDLPPGSIQHLLIVAPEFDGILVDRLRAAEHGPLSHAGRLNLSSSLAAVFSDKFATARWLEQRQLPTPQTWLASEEDRKKLTALQSGHPERQDCHGILKPRFGVGCDQVQLIPELPAPSMLAEPPDVASWVLQPRMRGRACSISLIGQGHHRPALILPPGRQRIKADVDGRLHYHGGQFPCHPDVAPVIVAVAELFRDALGPFRGWLGLDVVVDSAPSRPPRATIIEVNPRLCTSCIGYRQLTRENLTHRMLFPEASSEPVRWHTKTARFAPGPVFNGIDCT
jgi:predicted ATP-grasp superfamily ATP-dependent carboligase